MDDTRSGHSSARSTTTRRRWGGLVGGISPIVLLAGMLSGCSGDSTAGGPEPVADGSYRLLATSSTQEPQTDATLQVDGAQVVITQGSESVQGRLGDPVRSQHILCPPDGQGSPRSLAAAVQVDGLQMRQPALFGDCGQTSPSRVTLVDLASTTDEAFPFATWAEFCDSTDPDC